MRAKAKYYVEFHWFTNGWLVHASTFTREEALRVARSVQTKDMPEMPIRIRHKGRTLARWQNGKRVTT